MQVLTEWPDFVRLVQSNFIERLCERGCKQKRLLQLRSQGEHERLWDEVSLVMQAMCKAASVLHVNKKILSQDRLSLDTPTFLRQGVIKK